MSARFSVRRTFLLAILLAIALLWSLPVIATHEGGAMPSVEVHGNERTQTSYVVKLVEACLAQDGLSDDPHNPEEVRRCLINSRLFSEVAVTAERPHRYRVEVVERWTLIPLPFVQVTDDGESRVGGFLAESNLLGQGILLALGGTVGESGSTFFFTLSNPSVAFSPWSLRFSALSAADELRQTEGQETTEVFFEHRSAATLGLGYTYGLLQTELAVSHAVFTFEEREAYPPPDAVELTALVLNVEYDRSHYEFFYEEGWKGQLRVRQGLVRNDDLSHSTATELQSSYGIPARGGTALVLKGSAGQVEGGGIMDAIRLGGTPGFRGIGADQAWAEQYIALAVDYRIPVKQYDYGTWAVAPFGDAGWIRHRGGTESALEYQAVGVGAYLYLKQIAVPGVGVELGHNTKYEETFGSITVGFSI